MKDEKFIIVKNRNVGGTGYTLENGFHRQFEPGESKRIPMEELQQLSYAPGGDLILKDCLVIEDQNALDFLNLQVEPEYFYSEQDIKDILLNGSLDQLEDTLNFAPEGVIEILKKQAVDLEIPDIRKRDLISKKTGFNVNNAINVNKVLAEGEDPQPEQTAPKRKAPQPKAAAPQRIIKVIDKNN